LDKTCSALRFAAALVITGAVAAEPHPADVYTIGDSLHYSGLLTAAGLEQVKSRYGAARETPVWFVIDSGGGEVNIAMDFGDWIHAHGLNVRVVDRCLSACANYVFPAARVKVIEPGAVVAWHGSAIQTPDTSRKEIAAVIERDVMPRTAPNERTALRTKLLDETLEYVRAARARQRVFFERIGVDESVTTIGEGRPGIEEFWFLSVAAMARFGIDLVVAPADYPATDTARFGQGVVRYLELAGDGVD